MTVLTHARSRHRRWLASLVGLAALILPVSLLTTAAASAAQHSAAARFSVHCRVPDVRAAPVARHSRFRRS